VAKKSAAKGKKAKGKKKGMVAAKKRPWLKKGFKTKKECASSGAFKPEGASSDP